MIIYHCRMEASHSTISGKGISNTRKKKEEDRKVSEYLRNTQRSVWVSKRVRETLEDKADHRNLWAIITINSKWNRKPLGV